jgi:hypothetical protein
LTDAIKEKISQYQTSSPGNPRHTIRFMNDEDVGRSWDKEGYLVLQINGAATKVLQRGNIGNKLGLLREG